MFVFGVILVRIFPLSDIHSESGKMRVEIKIERIGRNVTFQKGIYKNDALKTFVNFGLYELSSFYFLGTLLKKQSKYISLGKCCCLQKQNRSNLYKFSCFSLMFTKTNTSHIKSF